MIWEDFSHFPRDFGHQATLHFGCFGKTWFWMTWDNLIWMTISEWHRWNIAFYPLLEENLCFYRKQGNS
jgi:hypothetical protein